jgi:DNA repair protein RecO (recombination protein O)
MEWSAEGIVLAARPLGEGGVILDALTREHGRHLGLVRGSGSRRLAGALEPGNLVKLTWRARIADQLGSYAIEPSQARAAALFHDRMKLSTLASLTAVASVALHEREAHPRVFEALDHVLRDAAAASALIVAAAAVSFELILLEDLGFGLDLSECAATGATQDLRFVSPKSARAVSEGAGAPYRDKLLRLPQFLLDHEHGAGWHDVADGLALTGFFLERQVLLPQQKTLPLARARFAELVAARAQSDTL